MTRPDETSQTVSVPTRLTIHGEPDPDSWIDVPVENADQWDARLWRRNPSDQADW